MFIFIWFGLLPAIRTIMQKQISDRPALALGVEGAHALPGPDNMAKIASDEMSAKQLQRQRINPVQSKLTELIDRDEKQVAEVLKQWLVRA
jgi:flagellar biosynthesis/type III secretory pathway M-ring protein FliF/YscJ